MGEADEVDVEAGSDVSASASVSAAGAALVASDHVLVRGYGAAALRRGCRLVGVAR